MANARESAEVAALIELTLRKQAEDDLYEFIRQAWPVIEGGKKFVGGWALRCMCEHLEEVFYGRILRLNINIPPRCTKSTAVSVCFPVWCWLKDSSLQLLTTSYLERLAIRDNVKSRRLMKSKWFQSRWGDRFQFSGDQDEKTRVDNMQGGYRVVAGLDSGITGDGGDIITIDDGNNVKDQGDTALENALSVYTDVLPTRFNNFNTGRLINVQQRTSMKDLSGYIEENQKKEFVFLTLPMEFESKRRCSTVPLKSTNGKKWTDPRTQDGELLWPERIGTAALATLKKAMGSEYSIAGQLQQRPAPSEGGMIKRAWFQPWKDDKPPTCSTIIQSWDTAMSEKKEASYSACTTFGIFNDNFGVPAMILLGAWRARLSFPELYDQVQRMARDYTATTKTHKINPKNRPDIVLVEEKSSGIPLIQTLNRTGLTLTAWRPDKYGDKVERVRKITHIIEAGRIYVPFRAPDFKSPVSYADMVISQFAVFPKGDSRDIVDTCSAAIQRILNSGWVLHPQERTAAQENDYQREHTMSEGTAFY